MNIIFKGKKTTEILTLKIKHVSPYGKTSRKRTMVLTHNLLQGVNI